MKDKFYYKILATGSKGNCILIGDDEDRYIIIDVGICVEKVESKLKDANIPIENIDAIFITHSHIDHIKYVGELANKYFIPVYCDTSTKIGVHNLGVNTHNLDLLEDQFVKINHMIIRWEESNHDCEGGLLYNIYYYKDDKEPIISVITDTGMVDIFKSGNPKALLIEANYSEGMLLDSDRPKEVIERNMGNNGHLSNKQCLEWIMGVDQNRLQEVALLHVSQSANCNFDIMLTIGEKYPKIKVELYELEGYVEVK